jgi:hypothetical protein
MSTQIPRVHLNLIHKDEFDEVAVKDYQDAVQYLKFGMRKMFNYTMICQSCWTDLPWVST